MTVSLQLEGGAIDLHKGFTDLPGLYVIGPQNPRDVKGREVYWKVGMSTNLRARLASHQICFPQGYWIRLLLTLPAPQKGWYKSQIRKAVLHLETLIHEALKKHPEVEHSDEVHAKGEWFKARWTVIWQVVERVLRDQGLLKRVRVHDHLLNKKYGVEEGTATEPSGRVLPGRPRKATAKVFRSIPTKQGDRLYTVQRVLGQRRRDGQLQYKVRWKGWSKAWDSWEDASRLALASDAVQDFKSEQQDSRARG